MNRTTNFHDSAIRYYDSHLLRTMCVPRVIHYAQIGLTSPIISSSSQSDEGFELPLFAALVLAQSLISLSRSRSRSSWHPERDTCGLHIPICTESHQNMKGRIQNGQERGYRYCTYKSIIIFRFRCRGFPLLRAPIIWIITTTKALKTSTAARSAWGFESLIS